MPTKTPTRRGRPQRGPHQLPAGRHGFTREFVQENQRARIVNATITVASVAGYDAMSVEDIIAAAGVSRRTFYDHFKSKEAAFLVAYQLVADAIVAADDVDLDVRGVVARLAALFAEHPAWADVALIEVFAAGTEAREAYERTAAFLVEAVDRRRDKRRKAPEVAVRMVVGGMLEVFRSHALGGRLDELPESAPAIATMLEGV